MSTHGSIGYVDQLQCSPLFSGVGRQELNQLLQHAQRRTIRAQQYIGWQGDACGEFYFLLNGFVKLRSRTQQGKDHTVGLIYPGNFFALEAMFSGNGYATTMEAIKDCDLLSFPTSRFLSFMKNQPILFYKVLSELSHEVVKLYSHIERQKTYTAQQKLVAWMLDHYDQEKADPAIPVPLLRTDLASMLGITPETLCREMKKLKQLGFVSGNNGTVSIANFEGLQTILEKDIH